MKNSNIHKLVISSIFATFVTISTFLGITIPIGEINTTFHLGNIVCLLAGIILGPIYGGFSAAIGSSIFDILSPIYITSTPFTFIFKFIMAFLTGKIAYSKNKNGNYQFYNILGAVIGSSVYIILRAIKSFLVNLYVLKMEPLTAILITSNGLLLSIIKTAFSIMAVAALLPIIQKKLIKQNFM